MSATTKLVMGASGFLGSTVTRLLVERGERVRVFLRESSSTTALEGLDVEIVRGDPQDADAVRRAMSGIEDVFYCIVDARAWLRDPTPLFQVNVDTLRTVLDVAVEQDLHRFVFTSTLGTLAVNPSRPVTETDPHNWLDQGGSYIRSRVEAEDLVMRYARDHGLPAVAMCVANTYGAHDYGPTPHGKVLVQATQGRLRWYVRGVGSEVVGIRDAAEALILASQTGQVGERYAIGERYLSNRELHDLAAAVTGMRARLPIPLWLLYAAGLVGDALAILLRRDLKLTTTSVRLMGVGTPLDHSKATTHLGWNPEPASTSVREAVEFFGRNPWVLRQR